MPRTFALLYLACGASWFLVAERLPGWLRIETVRAPSWRAAAAWLFVAGSALLLYALLRRQEKRSGEALAARALLTEAERANAELERRLAERARQLEAANRELESFTYAVSHDLRAPLRAMSGFSQILLDSSAASLDDSSRHYLLRIQEAGQRMASLLDDLLTLSRVGRSELNARAVDLSELAAQAAQAMRTRDPQRTVQIDIASGMSVTGDARLLRIVLESLLSNAWKYTMHAAAAQISVGVDRTGATPVYFVRDNGVGFDMAHAGKLFTPFQRLHAAPEFAGNGIGLATAQRILARHGGRIWADARPDAGATFYFTLEAAQGA